MTLLCNEIHSDMKHSILILLALAAFNTNAQTNKGDALVGVSFGSLSSTSSENKTTYSNTPTEYKSEGSSFSVSINPNVAYFISNNFAFGGGLSMSYYSSNSKSSNTGSTTTTESSYTQPSFYIGPLARYYFGNNEKGKPFVQFNYQYGISGGRSKSETSTGASSETTTKPKGDWNTGFSFGYEHFITPTIGFYGSLGFNYGATKTSYEYRPSTGTGYDYTSTYTRFYIPVNVGLQVHILTKTKK